MGLLDDYQKMVEEDKQNLNDNAPVEGLEMTADELEEYKKRLNEMRKEIEENEDCSVDCEKACNNTVSDPYERIFENDLKTECVKVTPMVKKAYCPECGKEIINTLPPMYNPFSFEKLNRFECDCGWKANLEYSYPRVVFVTDSGEEIEAFAK